MTVINVKILQLEIAFIRYPRHKALGNQASLVLLIKDSGIWERDPGEQAYAGMFTDLG